MSLLLFILINVFAGIFQGIVGLGHALIVTPLSLTFLSKGTVFTAVVVAGTVLNAYLSKQIKEPLDTKIFWPLLISAIIGMPFGVIILKTLPLNTLRIILGALSVVLVPIIMFVKIKADNLRTLTPITGFICGVLQTSASMTGPPVALLLSGTDISKDAMRKILVTFFFAISLVSIPLFMIGQLLTMQGVIFGLCVVPFIIVGGYLGNKAAHYIPQHWYRALTLVTITATGAFAIYSGLK